MEIKGLEKTSMVDWEGKISCVLFLPGCNFRCPYCFNKNLVLNHNFISPIPFSTIESYLNGQGKRWIDGVVITGGEPTIHTDLHELCEKIKELGYPIKLDTNGSNPKKLRYLIENKLVDYIAMDVKSVHPDDFYKITKSLKNTIFQVFSSIDLLFDSKIEYEFRTTLIPTIYKKYDIKLISAWLVGSKKYYLQRYKSDVDTVDPRYSRLKDFTNEEYEMFLKTAQEFIPNTKMRN